MLRERKLLILAIGSLAIRALFIAIKPLDSDEPQHLHVVWAWSRGLVQYRDVFDNHFPLLHLLFAPLMRVLPESSSIFTAMRCAIAPIALGCSWLLFKIGEPLIGRRAAIVAAILFSVAPPWLPVSTEFRNDTLWIFFWLAALAFRDRPFARGVAAALCLLASVKALPLLLAHALAVASTRQPLAIKPLARFACGAAPPMLAFALFFGTIGAFDSMLYATLFYNVSLPVEAGRRIGGAGSFAVMAPVLALRAPRGAAHLVLTAIWYPLILLCLWPSITPRDFLPLVPLAALGVGQALSLSLLKRQAESLSGLKRQAESLSYTTTLLFIGAAIGSVMYADLRSTEPSRARFVDAALALTKPDDFIYDLKGDTVFRRRPVHQIYDIVGRALTNNGTLADRGPEQIAANGCCVAIADVSYIPPRTRAFLNASFIGNGPLRVCGANVRDGTFTIGVPQVYAVIARDPSRIRIDGVPYSGPRFLDSGKHTLSSTESNLRVVWWRAAQTNRYIGRPSCRDSFSAF